ncbi:MAG TPA: DUF475 domain-containing protein [Rectinemataceae bacterium]|nr:DUF475 domain-containing protein [Rectinemataceae bacterium]
MLAMMLVTVLGLALFETVSSIDNAIINAEVLGTMGQKARRWFLTWGIFFAVFLVRGLMPWLIIWLATPGIGPIEALFAAFSNDHRVLTAVEEARPALLMAGGVFLVFLFLHWLFLEEKHFGLPGERFISRQGAWFYAIGSVGLLSLVWFAQLRSGSLAFAAVLGSTAFFIIHGFKETAERQESGLAGSALSDLSKLLYLEAIDLTFSIDGVLGAFAFTLSVPLILLGNGLGAVVVRQLTVGNIERIKKLIYIKNGAMYSILGLGGVMVAEAFGVELPEWLTPLLTFAVVGWFFAKSLRANKAKG